MEGDWYAGMLDKGDRLWINESTWEKIKKE